MGIRWTGELEKALDAARLEIEKENKEKKDSDNTSVVFWGRVAKRLSEDKKVSLTTEAVRKRWLFIRKSTVPTEPPENGEFSEEQIADYTRRVWGTSWDDWEVKIVIQEYLNMQASKWWEAHPGCSEKDLWRELERRCIRRCVFRNAGACASYIQSLERENTLNVRFAEVKNKEPPRTKPSASPVVAEPSVEEVPTPPLTRTDGEPIRKPVPPTTISLGASVPSSEPAPSNEVLDRDDPLSVLRKIAGLLVDSGIFSDKHNKSLYWGLRRYLDHTESSSPGAVLDAVRRLLVIGIPSEAVRNLVQDLARKSAAMLQDEYWAGSETSTPPSEPPVEQQEVKTTDSDTACVACVEREESEKRAGQAGQAPVRAERAERVGGIEVLSGDVVTIQLGSGHAPRPIGSSW